MQALNERVTGLDKEIAALSSQQAAYRHLLTIPGVARSSRQRLSVKWMQGNFPAAESYLPGAAGFPGSTVREASNDYPP